MNILLIDNGQPFTLETPYVQPLGGSETSLLLLAKGLSELGHSVILLTTATVNVPQQNDNLLVHNINNWPQVYDQAQLIIFNRTIIPEILFVNDGKLKCYYAHDAYDQTHIISTIAHSGIYNRLAKILCVSEWQRWTFNKYLGIPEIKLSVLGNSIDLFLYQGYTERNPNKFIFASIPYKGIDIIGDLFNDICIRSKHGDLELHIFSSMSLYGLDSDSEYEMFFDKLSKIKNVFLYKPKSMREMAVELLSAGFYIHPSTYHETFGMMFIMAQAAGCLPITVNNGAASEIITDGHDGFIIDCPTLKNFNCYNNFIDRVITLLDKDLYKIRLNAQQSSKKWLYLNIAKRLLKILNLY